MSHHRVRWTLSLLSLSFSVDLHTDFSSGFHSLHLILIPTWSFSSSLYHTFLHCPSLKVTSFASVLKWDFYQRCYPQIHSVRTEGWASVAPCCNQPWVNWYRHSPPTSCLSNGLEEVGEKAFSLGPNLPPSPSCVMTRVMYICVVPTHLFFTPKPVTHVPILFPKFIRFWQNYKKNKKTTTLLLYAGEQDVMERDI